jgi:gliding motility-associated-like protein
MNKSIILPGLIILLILTPAVMAQIPTNGLVASFPFNGNANDESGNGFNGIVHGATLTTDRCDKDNSAYFFDGYSNYIALPVSMAINSDNSFSIVAWINNYTITSDSRYSDNAIFGQTDGEAGTDFPIIAFEVKIDNTIRVLVRGSDNPPVDFRSVDAIQNNTWNQVAMVSDALKDSIAIYINGQLAKKVKSDFTGNTTTNDWLSFGAYYDDLLSIFHFFSGKIDDVLIYDRALSDEEIKKLYTPCLEFALQGDSSVCQGNENVSYNLVSNTAMTNYEWTYTGAGVTIKGNTDTITLNFSDSATSGNLKLTAVSNGVDTIASEISILVDALPGAAGIISGESEVCSSQTGILYNISPVANATVYDWQYSGSQASISGISNQISMDFYSNATGGKLTVSGKNKCGRGASSPGFEIALNPLPGNAGAITGLHEVCQNTADVAFSIESISNATSYVWNYSGNDVTLQGNTENVSLYLFNDASSGNLTVYGLNSCGSGYTSEPFPIIVKSCSESPERLNIPNAFSPNGDGTNDNFVIKGLSANSRLQVFDRSGKKLYDSEDYQNDWDGKDEEGKILESGTYWYILIVPDMQNEYKGFLYLKR